MFTTKLLNETFANISPYYAENIDISYTCGAYYFKEYFIQARLVKSF